MEIAFLSLINRYGRGAITKVKSEAPLLILTDMQLLLFDQVCNHGYINVLRTKYYKLRSPFSMLGVILYISASNAS